MLALLVAGPGRSAVRDVPEPVLLPGDVLVSVDAAGICGSDLELLDGRRPAAYVSYPVVPGHEWAGRVEALGPEVRDLAPGDPIVAEGLRSCGVCDRCAEGRTNLCAAGYAETGFTHPGALAERLVVPARLVHRLPADRPLEPAALLEPAACVASGLLEAGMPLPGMRVAVVGDGPVGLLALLLLRTATPAELVLVGGRPARSALGPRCGATRVVAADDPAGLAGLAGRFDAVVEAANDPAGAATALALLRRGGTAVLLGISGLGRATIDPDTVTLNQLRVQGGFAASSAAWRWVAGLYADGALDPAPLVTHRFGLDQVDAAFAALTAPDGEAVKILIRPGGASSSPAR
jgi:threonine dehydrogenase-like Zn-dependent dehydrogenase